MAALARAPRRSEFGAICWPWLYPPAALQQWPAMQVPTIFSNVLVPPPPPPFPLPPPPPPPSPLVSIPQTRQPLRASRASLLRHARESAADVAAHGMLGRGMGHSAWAAIRRQGARSVHRLSRAPREAPIQDLGSFEVQRVLARLLDAAVVPQLDEPPEGPAVTALLDQVPVHTLQETSTEPCVVCREPMLAGEEVRRLPCLHVFHQACIDQWLRRRPTCPLDNLRVEDLLHQQRSLTVCGRSRSGRRRSRSRRSARVLRHEGRSPSQSARARRHFEDNWSSGQSGRRPQRRAWERVSTGDM